MRPLDSLQAAWDWYRDTRRQLYLFGRLTRKYWNALPWDGLLARDDNFSSVEGADLAEQAVFSLSHLDDLAIVVLFSVFESAVREQVLKEVQTEAVSIRHRAIKAAANDVTEAIQHGSFFQVLQPYKDENAALVEEVNQVRRFRNWVAHGKRGMQPDIVTPQIAFERLNRFLSLVQPTLPLSNP